MQLCHGRRRCTISADSSTFGNPCRPNSRMYLKTVYTCGEFIFRAISLRVFFCPIRQMTRAWFCKIDVKPLFIRILCTELVSFNCSYKIVKRAFLNISFPVPRKVLSDSYNNPLELDELNQPESDYDSDLDEDDGHYNLNAVPPAPKLQGTVPRSGDSNTTQIASNKANDGNLNLLSNQRTFTEGKSAQQLNFFSYICRFHRAKVT